MKSFEPDIEELYAYAVEVYGKLRLPPCELRLRPRGGSAKPLDVYDGLRRKWVALTPEEWVRQHFVAYMIEQLGYSPLRMANEVSLTLNDTARRADTVVYDHSLRPVVVVEYKAPSISLTEEVLQQALRYNLVFNATGIMITNGMDVFSVKEGQLFRGVIKSDD